MRYACLLCYSTTYCTLLLCILHVLLLVLLVKVCEVCMQSVHQQALLIEAAAAAAAAAGCTKSIGGPHGSPFRSKLRDRHPTITADTAAFRSDISCMAIIDLEVLDVEHSNQ